MPRLFALTLRMLLLLVLLGVLASLTFAPRPLIAAEGDAHGGEPDTPAAVEDPVHRPGPAVLAERTTARWSEPGETTSPIALSFDPQGNLYIVETDRAGQAVLDQRWDGLLANDGVNHDLQKTSVEDRAAEIEELIANGTYTRAFFTEVEDRIVILSDADGDGKADPGSRQIFADSFNDELDGIAAGVLWLDGKVYLTNIPNLWLLEDKDGDGDADEETDGERVSLSYGYGVRWTFYGHDMHGLVMGPDGRLYFSMGDRGFNVTTVEGKHLYGPGRGGVFRMWPDGSELELYYEGLRNPQELAFDNFGNLFTGDNNCDAGDLARFAYLPEGGDSGWRQDVQSLDSRGPWKREEIWKPRRGKDDPTQPAWIIPPLANVGVGPSGLAHYPGTGDSFEPNGSFLMCDFPLGVRHVQTRPDGAFFKVTEDSTFVADATITDLAWGYDGRLYLAHWGGGWQSNPNGYIMTMANDALRADADERAVIDEVESLFTQGFGGIEDLQLLALLGHRDQRVRLHAQYEIAKREGMVGALTVIASSPKSPRLGRVHAIWTLSMIARRDREAADFIARFLVDDDQQVRSQAVKMLGDLAYPATDQYITMLEDEFGPAQMHAALALGKTGAAEGVGPLLDLLAANDDDDPVLRHTASYALSLIVEADAVTPSDVVEAVAERSAAARLGVVLTLRRLESPILEDYLDDPDTLVAAEAARAIYDRRVMDSFEDLAGLIAGQMPAAMMIEPVLRRSIEANVRLGGNESANRLAAFAANPDAPAEYRLLAMDELAAWGDERNREGVWGSWWPRDPQSAEPALDALASGMDAILKSSRDKVNVRAREIELRLLANDDVELFEQLAISDGEPALVRTAALDRLAQSDPDRAKRVCNTVSDLPRAPENLKNHARALLGRLDAAAAVGSYIRALSTGTLVERQAAVTALATFDAEEARSAMHGLGRDLVLGKIAPELRLDVYYALLESDDLQLKSKALQYDQRQRVAGQPWIRDAVLAGGDAEAGLEIFKHNETAGCAKCHVAEQGLPDTAGPNLWNVGSMHTADYLYRALIDPSADIAESFRSVTLTLKDGKTLAGRIDPETATPTGFVLIDGQTVRHEIKVNQIESRTVSEQSQMLSMGDKLTDTEARDVIAFLVAQQDEKLGPAKAGVSGHAGHQHGASPARSVLFNPMPKDKMTIYYIVLPIFMLGVCVLLGALLLLTLATSPAKA